jgi:hypothetical protein
VKRHTVALLSLLLSAPVPSGRTDSFPQQHGLEGRWEGAIVIVPAEQEIEVAVDLNRSQRGQLGGQVYFPMTGPSPSVIQGLSLQNAHISFHVRDEEGVVTSFDGALRDGSMIAGTMTERGKTLPFSLHRRIGPAPRSKAGIGGLLDGIALPAIFDRDVGRRRILLILSPALYSSRMTLSLVRRYVLDTNADPNLRLYVLWEVPPNVAPAEAERVVRQTASIATDVRATHFWSPNRTLRNSLQASLGPYGTKPIANPCLLFSGDKKWGATPPVPDQVRIGPQFGSKANPSPRDRFNGINFALDVILRPTGAR